jgi:hypothetical protein
MYRIFQDQLLNCKCHVVTFQFYQWRKTSRCRFCALCQSQAPETKNSHAHVVLHKISKLLFKACLCIAFNISRTSFKMSLHQTSLNWRTAEGDGKHQNTNWYEIEMFKAACLHMSQTISRKSILRNMFYEFRKCTKIFTMEERIDMLYAINDFSRIFHHISTVD